MLLWGATGALTGFMVNGLRNLPLASNPKNYIFGVVSALGVGYVFETVMAKKRYHQARRMDKLRQERLQ